jgi:hypothetical protein
VSTGATLCTSLVSAQQRGTADAEGSCFPILIEISPDQFKPLEECTYAELTGAAARLISIAVMGAQDAVTGLERISAAVKCARDPVTELDVTAFLYLDPRGDAACGTAAGSATDTTRSTTARSISQWCRTSCGHTERTGR